MVHLHQIHQHLHRNSDTPTASPQRPKYPPDIDNPPFYLPLRSFGERYRVISNLGNGSFGNVSLAKIKVDLRDSSKFKLFRKTLLERNDEFIHENFNNKRTGVVAIKTMTKRLDSLNDYTRVKEIRFILSVPYHKNLVQVYEMFIDNSDFKLHIVMECLDQNLYQLIKARKSNHFSQMTLKSILSQILNGLRHIHRHNYFHRDVKPENILVSPTNMFYDQSYLHSDLFKYQDSFIVKIADYGLARQVDNRRPYTSYVSTRWYRAPEILLRKNWYSRPVDIWAFGSVAAEVVTFRPLFPGSDELEQTCKVLEVLGTPLSRNGIENYFPSYGYWDEALFLSNQLGLSFPQRRCIDIEQIIPNPELSSLCDVIRACLAWNPNTRADAEKICAMPYFKNTCVDDHSSQPINIKTEKPAYTTSILEKSERLAGIPPLQKQLVKHESSNVSISSSPQAVDLNMSFLDDADYFTKLYQHRTSDNVYTYQKESPSHLPPNLTQESIQTNDENSRALLNSFAHHVPIGSKTELRKSLSQLPNSNVASIQSFVDFNSTDFSNNTTQKSLYERSFQMDPYQHHMAFQGVTNESTSFRNLESSEFIDWSKFEGEVDDKLDLGTTGMSLNGGNYDGKLGFNGVTEDSLLGLYENKKVALSYNLQENGTDISGCRADTDGFTGELYSKFNLRRLNLHRDDEASNNSYLVDYGDSFGNNY